MSNLISAALLYVNSTYGKTNNDSYNKIDNLMAIDDWTGHEEEYENEIIEYFNSINIDRCYIRKTLDDIRDKHDIDFTPEICERCGTIMSEGWICNGKPYCSEDCITDIVSEDSWISMQEYEPDENRRKTFWG